MNDASQPRVRPDGTPLSEKAIRRGLRFSILASSFGMPFFLLQGMPLTMLLDSIHASGVAIGLMGTIQQLAMLVQIPAALISELLPVRKWYWYITALISRFVWLFIALLPLVLRGHTELMVTAIATIVAVSALFGQAGAATWWSWMSDVIPERSRSRFWSTRQASLFTVFLVATGVIGYVLDLFPDPREPNGTFLGFSLVFGICALLGCAEVTIHLWVPEPRPTRPEGLRHPLRKIIAPLRDADFRFLTASMSMWGLSVGLIGAFGALYLRELGLTYTGLSITAISSILGTIIASFVWAYVLDRVGSRNLAVITMILAPMCGIAWFFVHPGSVTLPAVFGHALTIPQPLFVITLSSLLGGAIYSGVGLAHVNLLGYVVPREGRTVAMAVHFCIVGLCAALGPIGGGWLMDRIKASPLDITLPTGTQIGYIHAQAALHMLTCWFVVAPLMAQIRRRTGEMGFRTALSRVVIFNPFRMVTNIQQIYSMGSANTRFERADAIRKLGDQKTALAVGDIIKDLESPSLEIREEAAIALGKIGSADAVDALLAKLKDEEADMALTVVRALRIAGSPHSLHTLTALIEDSGTDREVLVEVVRALGAVESRKAVDPLLGLLRTSQDTKVLLACAESLVRHHCFNAAYDIVHRMDSTDSRLLKQGLTVSLGDLLGERGGFYRFLTREERTRGSAVEGVIGRVTRAVRQIDQERGKGDGAGALIVGLLERLETAYLEGNVVESIRLLYEITLRVARLDYALDFPGDLDAFVETLLWHDEQFAVAAWFVGIINGTLDGALDRSVESTDALLGIYFLSGWAKRRVKG